MKTLEEQLQAPEEGAPGRKKFGTFGGVFTPTLLTILSVIMYLREGWVVGNAGILGAFNSYVSQAPQADLNIFGLVPDPNFDFIRRMVEETNSTCLFVRDSGRESALA